MRKLIPYIITEAAVYNLLPLIAYIPFFKEDLGVFIMILFVYYPLTSLLCGLIYGTKHGFSIVLILANIILFIPAMFIYYNISAWVYIIPYTILLLLGNTVGALVHKKKIAKQALDNQQ